jgi:hypothetical protein
VVGFWDVVNMLNHAQITKFKICPTIVVEYDMVDSGTALRNYFNSTFIMHIHLLLLLLWCFSPFLGHGLPNLLPSLLFFPRLQLRYQNISKLYRVGLSTPTWRTGVSLFVWVISLDLSGIGAPASGYATAGIALRML